MTLKDKMKTYNFWISLVSAILLVARIIADKFNFEIDSSLVMDITTGLCGIFVVLGIISAPQKTDGKTVETAKTETSLLEVSGAKTEISSPELSGADPEIILPEEKELNIENTLASEVVAKTEILSASEKVAETGTLSTGEIVAEDETVVVQGNDLKSEMPSTNENATKTETLLQGVTKTAFESGNECTTKPENLLQTASVENPVTVETNLTNGETLTGQGQSVNASNQGLNDVSGELK